MALPRRRPGDIAHGDRARVRMRGPPPRLPAGPARRRRRRRSRWCCSATPQSPVHRARAFDGSRRRARVSHEPRPPHLRIRCPRSTVPLLPHAPARRGRSRRPVISVLEGDLSRAYASSRRAQLRSKEANRADRRAHSRGAPPALRTEFAPRRREVRRPHGRMSVRTPSRSSGATARAASRVDASFNFEIESATAPRSARRRRRGTSLEARAFITACSASARASPSHLHCPSSRRTRRQLAAQLASIARTCSDGASTAPAPMKASRSSRQTCSKTTQASPSKRADRARIGNGTSPRRRVEGHARVAHRDIVNDLAAAAS